MAAHIASTTPDAFKVDLNEWTKSVITEKKEASIRGVEVGLVDKGVLETVAGDTPETGVSVHGDSPVESVRFVDRMRGVFAGTKPAINGPITSSSRLNETEAHAGWASLRSGPGEVVPFLGCYASHPVPVPPTSGGVRMVTTGDCMEVFKDAVLVWKQGQQSSDDSNGLEGNLEEGKEGRDIPSTQLDRSLHCSSDTLLPSSSRMVGPVYFGVDCR